MGWVRCCVWIIAPAWLQARRLFVQIFDGAAGDAPSQQHRVQSLVSCPMQPEVRGQQARRAQCCFERKSSPQSELHQVCCIRKHQQHCIQGQGPPARADPRQMCSQSPRAGCWYAHWMLYKGADTILQHCIVCGNFGRRVKLHFLNDATFARLHLFSSEHALCTRDLPPDPCRLAFAPLTS